MVLSVCNCVCGRVDELESSHSHTCSLLSFILLFSEQKSFMNSWVCGCAEDAEGFFFHSVAFHLIVLEKV